MKALSERDRRLVLVVYSLMLGAVIGAELARAKERRRAVEAIDQAAASAKRRIRFPLGI